VDEQVAPVAGRVGPAVLARLVAEAIARFDPEAAALAEIEALEARHATITLTRAISELGDAGIPLGRLEAVLEAADALDLDAALAELAADLATAGDTSPLDVRRSRALGLLARGQSIDLPDQPDHTDHTGQPDGSAGSGQLGEPDEPSSAGIGGSVGGTGTGTGTVGGSVGGIGGAVGGSVGVGVGGSVGRVGAVRARRREVVLHVHLAEQALHGAGDGIATVCSHTGHRLGQVTVEQVQDWCATPDANIIVKPVLDLAATLRSSGYQPSARLRDQVIALNPTCVFPHCHRPSMRLDLDHIAPYQPDDPHARTSSENLAPLCRRHHRAKTHGGWTYLRLGPAEHLWTSPHGYQWVTDTDGTRPVPSPATRPVVELADTG
jgi:hypothetical protein